MSAIPHSEDADAFSAHTYFMTNPSLSGRGRALKIDQPRPVAIASATDVMAIVRRLRTQRHWQPARSREARGPVAIVDIGSNSVRLVIYESQTRNAATLQNEKAICAIGRDMVTTGRLHAEGCAAALEALARFRMIADGLKVETREAVATAAARDASNGAEFIRRAEAAWGAPIRVLAGEDEARIAAEGVVAGIPDADGLVADLGGGSLDMVTVKGGKTGEACTLPFGPLAADGPVPRAIPTRRATLSTRA